MLRLTSRPIVCVIVLLLLASPGVMAQQTTPSEEAGNQAYRQGSFGDAVEQFTKALSETDDPNHRARLQVQIAWTLFALGQEAEVGTHLGAALVEDPTLTLDDSYYSQEFLDLFKSTQRRAFESSNLDGVPAPDLEATIASVNERMDSKSDLEGALVDIDRLLGAYPRDGRLIPIKVQILTLLGREDEANNLTISRGVATDSQGYQAGFSVSDLILRANRLLEAGDATTALQLVQQAVQRQPNNPFALELMAEAAQQTADWQSAEFALKSALGLQPDNIGLKLRLGEVYLATFEASAARDVFKELTEDYPTSDRAWASLGLLEARLQNNQRALDSLARALFENPMLPEVQLARGELLLLGGDFDGAVAALEAAEKLIPNDAQLEARLGQALLAKRRNDEALSHLRAAIEGGFGPPDVQRSLALALALNEMYSESKRVLVEARADAGGDHAVVVGYLALKRGLYSDAEEILTGVANGRPNDAASVNLLTASIYPQSRFDEAVALLGRAHELDPTLDIVEANLVTAKAARAAEVLSTNARAVKAIPQK
jgi:tetratricopeptide (TPR) repeat protein